MLPNDNFTKRSFAKKIHNSLIYWAVPRGVEPPTFGLGNRRAIILNGRAVTAAKLLSQNFLPLPQCYPDTQHVAAASAMAASFKLNFILLNTAKKRFDLPRPRI